jgi:hypothetical protein
VKTTWTRVLAVVCVGAAWPCRPDEEKKKPVPLYTNEDLRRVAPYRDETGVNSTAAAAPAAVTPPGGRARGEEYWRREADRLRDRLRPLRERAAELRLRIDERRRRPRVPVYGDPQVVALERRLRVVEERIREAESRLEERARRERALPGWIR